MKWINIALIAVFLAITLQGCATSTNLQTTHRINVDEDYDKVILKLAGLAKQCWAREYSPWGDAIEIRYSNYGITANRAAPDLGVMKPMFSASLLDSGEKKSTVILSEGECDFLCTKNGYSDDVVRWLNGDETCSTS